MGSGYTLVTEKQNVISLKLNYDEEVIIQNFSSLKHHTVIFVLTLILIEIMVY